MAEFDVSAETSNFAFQSILEGLLTTYSVEKLGFSAEAKISGDMAQLDSEVPRTYRPPAIALRESSRFASAKTCPQLSPSMLGRRKNVRSGKSGFSTE